MVAKYSNTSVDLEVHVQDIIQGFQFSINFIIQLSVEWLTFFLL